MDGTWNCLVGDFFTDSIPWDSSPLKAPFGRIFFPRIKQEHPSKVRFVRVCVFHCHVASMSRISQLLLSRKFRGSEARSASFFFWGGLMTLEQRQQNPDMAFH